MYSKLYYSSTSTAAPAAIIRGFERMKSEKANNDKTTVSAAILPCADLHKVLQASKDFALMQKAIY